MDHGQSENLDFARLARNRSPGFLNELWQFVRATGKWWLVPVLTVLLILGVFMILSASGFAPFIYTLF